MCEICGDTGTVNSGNGDGVDCECVLTPAEVMSFAKDKAWEGDKYPWMAYWVQSNISNMIEWLPVRDDETYVFELMDSWTGSSAFIEECVDGAHRRIYATKIKNVPVIYFDFSTIERRFDFWFKEHENETD